MHPTWQGLAFRRNLRLNMSSDLDSVIKLCLTFTFTTPKKYLYYYVTNPIIVMNPIIPR